MEKLNLELEGSNKEIAKKFNINKYLFSKEVIFSGRNLDITEPYFWIFNFAYYTGKAYTTLKLEDYHYFSEASQYGQGIRQMKGNSIRVFQENFNQLLQLIKVHMLPLLKEVKQADFYNNWLKKITHFDALYREEKKKSYPNKEKLQSYKNERDEAINHIKDKWVNEVDGGRMWQMNRSSTEQGLDYALLPQLFFGTNLTNPLYEMHKTGKSLKEQLDEDIYTVDITKDAKEQVARFMYKFYIWLPSAIREADTTFRIKLASLKQHYSTVQMNINFIKPLLIEINRKTEGHDKASFYNGFETEDPHFVNIFDTSYSFVRTLGIRNFSTKDRGKHHIDDLEWSEFGLYVDSGKGDMMRGKYTGKSGFIIGEDDDDYLFIQSDKQDISVDKFNELEKSKVKVNKKHLLLYPIMELEFLQKRRSQMENIPQQGVQPVPFMVNSIKFITYAWNIVEIAKYRESLKEDNLELLEGFIEEVAIVKDDLLKYTSYLKGDKSSFELKLSKDKKDDNGKSSSNSNNSDWSLLTGPFQGMYELVKPIIPSFNFGSGKSTNNASGSSDDFEGGDGYNEKQHIIRLSAIEDTWKVYTIFKAAHGGLGFFKY